MTSDFSKQEAKRALDAVEQTRSRAILLRGYERGAPHFFIWGLVWLVGYGFSVFEPAWSVAAWRALVIVGGGLSYFITRSISVQSGHPDWRYSAAAVALILFVLATFFVMGVSSNRSVAAFPPLVVATAYCVVGLWGRTRILVSGVVIAALTLTGFAILKDDHYFLLWMAVVGGGSLILTGFWLRRA